MSGVASAVLGSSSIHLKLNHKISTIPKDYSDFKETCLKKL